MRRLLDNLPVKAASLALAVLLWFVIAGEKTSERGMLIAVELQNFPKDLELTGDPVNQVEVRLRASPSLIQQLGCLILDSLHFNGHLVLGGSQITLRLVSGAQAVCNALLPFRQGSRQRRPDELHAEEHKERKRNGLPQQGQINVHTNTSFGSCGKNCVCRITWPACR